MQWVDFLRCFFYIDWIGPIFLSGLYYASFSNFFTTDHVSESINFLKIL
jgi:hypothetical protein